MARLSPVYQFFREEAACRLLRASGISDLLPVRTGLGDPPTIGSLSPRHAQQEDPVAWLEQEDPPEELLLVACGTQQIMTSETPAASICNLICTCS
jgi:hypothetical protein